jgi:hypothetical protein
VLNVEEKESIVSPPLIRDGHYQVGSVLLGGSHVFGQYYLNWGVSAARSRLAALGGGPPNGTGPAAATPPSFTRYGEVRLYQPHFGAGEYVVVRIGDRTRDGASFLRAGYAGRQQPAHEYN